MSKVRREIAGTIAEQLIAAELAADEAYGSVAHLAAMLPSLRQRAGVSAVVANNVFTGVARVMDLQAQVRSALVDVHLNCQETAEAFNITSYGDDGGCIPPGGSLDAQPSIRRVA